MVANAPRYLYRAPALVFRQRGYFDLPTIPGGGLGWSAATRRIALPVGQPWLVEQLYFLAQGLIRQR